MRRTYKATLVILLFFGVACGVLARSAPEAHGATPGVGDQGRRAQKRVMSRDAFETIPFTVANAQLSKEVLRAIRPDIRILIVVDGEISLEPGGSGFSIGRLVDLLDSPPAWTRLPLRANFRADLARRGLGNPASNPNAQRYDPMYENFSFVMDGFNLDNYDEVWLFGLWSEEHPGALSGDEVAVLSAWMDRGGGVFATGDHGTLGAALGQNIPRVRSMRRWASTQHPPPQYGPDRHVTTQPSTLGQGSGYEIIPFANERDTIPQPITPTTGYLRDERDDQGRLVRVETVHPLLCGIGAPVTVLPDHPHEGEVMDFVNLEDWSTTEYPSMDGIRPRPQVVARARSGRPAGSGALLQYEGGPVAARTFAAIGAYDGQQVGVGRVVVDASLHHWLDLNLEGLTTEDLARVQMYHVNVALWLAGPEHRWLSAVGGLMTAILTYPGVTEIHHRASDLRTIGEGTTPVLRRILPDCEIATLVMNPRWNEEAPELEEPAVEPLPEACLSCPPWEQVATYVLGGMVESVGKTVADLDRPGTPDTLDGSALRQQIESAVTYGAASGRQQFTADLRASFKTAEALAVFVDQLGRK